jgi:hypothetical protein
MPDGGVVAIRQHNPAGCNAFFNIFDLRRVRPIWQDWSRVRSATHRAEYEPLAPEFARRSAYAFDDFQLYYGVFFSLLQAGERILYLDAEEWHDGITTVLKDTQGEPLLLHCWYTRNFATSYHTRRRYQAAIDHARKAQGTFKLASRETNSNLGKWDAIYGKGTAAQPYGDTLTYEKAAKHLEGLALVEDWGCGWGWFKQYLPASTTYRGIDGSHSPHADVIADLTQYTSQADGILLRHVLEHNQAWEDILKNALRSFTKRMVLVLFTPFAEKTHVIRHSAEVGVPDIAFAKEDLTRHFSAVHWRLEEGLKTRTQYGVEHVFYIATTQDTTSLARPYNGHGPGLKMP